MKIAISCNAFEYCGGSERYAIDVTKELLDRGLRPTIFTRRYDPRLKAILGCEIITCNTKILPSKARDYYYDCWLGKKRKEHGISTLFGCNRNSHSDVAMCGGTHLGFLRAMNKKEGLFDKLQINLEKQYYENANSIVAHSLMMKHELEELYGINKDKIHLIYPPANSNTFHPVDASQKKALRERLNLPTNKTIFLFPSTGHTRKGLPLIASFFEKTRLPVLLIVAGKPLPKDIPNVRYIGLTDTIEEYYQSADFCILGSKYEPFGLIGVESILCGTPLVFADNIGSLEVINPSYVYKFSNNSFESLELAIKNALSKTTDGKASPLNEPQFVNHYSTSIKDHVDKLITLFR